MAGQDWQPPWAPLLKDVYIYPIPAWSLFRQDGYGYCRLQANRDRLTLTYITSKEPLKDCKFGFLMWIFNCVTNMHGFSDASGPSVVRDYVRRRGGANIEDVHFC